MIAGGNHTIMYAILLVAPVAVPDKIIASRWMLDFIDRCHSLASLTPPQAALGSLPPLGRLLLATFLAGDKKSGPPEDAMLRVRRRKYTSHSVAAGATARVAPTRFETHSAFQTTI